VKILIIAPWIGLGGAEILSIHLAHELKRLGHNVTIATLFVDHKGLPPIAKSNFYLTPPKIISKLCHKWRLAFFIIGPIFLFLTVLKHAREVDILNPHNFPSFWVAFLVSKLRKIPVVWTCNEPPPIPRKKDIPTIGIFDYLGWTIASSRVDTFFVSHFKGPIVVPSLKTQKDVLKRYNKKSYINYIGIDYDFFSKGKVRSKIEGIEIKDKFVLACIGKLHPQKNQEIILQALSLVSAKIPKACLLLVGDGPEKDRLKLTAQRLKIAGKTFFLGVVKRNVLRDVYRNTNINLFPAIDHQSWGFTPIEALCTGVISIASKDTGVSEFLQEGSCGVVAEATAESFAEEILQVYKNRSKYTKMANKGREIVKKNLTWTAYASRYLDIIFSYGEKY